MGKTGATYRVPRISGPTHPVLLDAIMMRPTTCLLLLALLLNLTVGAWSFAPSQLRAPLHTPRQLAQASPRMAAAAVPAPPQWQASTPKSRVLSSAHPFDAAASTRVVPWHEYCALTGSQATVSGWRRMRQEARARAHLLSTREGRLLHLGLLVF